MQKIKRDKLVYYILFSLAFISIFVFLIWKCRYGFGSNDESFYLATPLRLYQGDALFADEWHLSQMSSVLLLPFVSIYMLVCNSTVGMILTFRYVYVIVNSIVALFLFYRLRKYSYIGAFVASLAFLIYAPYCISALSYNTFGIINLSVALVLILTSETKLFLQYALAGVFYAASCLCCPYLVSLFFIYLLVFIIFSIIKKIKKTFNKTYLFEFKTFFPIFVGVFITLLLFLIFVFSRASLKNIIESFQNIMSDPAHIRPTFFDSVYSYFFYLINLTSISKITYLIILCLSVTGLFLQKTRKFILGIITLLVICIVTEMVINAVAINFVMFPINILALIAVMFMNKRVLWKIFGVVWIPGMIYSFCIHLGSNQAHYCITSASTVALIGSIIILTVTVKTCIFTDDESKMGNALIIVSMCFMMAIQLTSELYLRYQKNFWDEDTPNLSFDINEGIEKGLITSELQSVTYNNFLSATSVINNYKNAKSILFFSERTGSYLLFPRLRNSAFSAWMSIPDDQSFAVTRQNEYYNNHKGKLPDLVYVDPGFLSCINEMNFIDGYSSIDLTDGSVLLIKPGIGE